MLGHMWRESWLFIPWLASDCRELGGRGGEDSGSSDTGQMMNHRFPVCRTMGRKKEVPPEARLALQLGALGTNRASQERV